MCLLCSFIFGPINEIVLILEEHSMILQSMSASPFIGPFMNTVRKWEKNLMLISEIIDEWLAMQRKWLYLEGIFISGDIREQLPDEARKFDDIDKSFRRVSYNQLSPCRTISRTVFCRSWLRRRRSCQFSTYA